MTFRKTLLGGAAILLVATGAIAGESTPAEKAQTRQLNIDAMTYAKGVPADQALPASIAPPVVDYAAAVQPPAAPVSPDASALTKPLSSIDHPSPSLANATVMSSDGQTVGLVQKVQLDSSGRASTLDVALKDLGKTVSFSANDVSYDASKNTVIATASSDEITNMPGSTPQG